MRDWNRQTLFVFFICFFIIQLFPQAASKVSPKVEDEKTKVSIEPLNEKLAQTEKLLNESREKILALEKEMIEYKVSKSFFHSEMANFTVIVSIIIGLIALISFGSIKLEFNRKIREVNNSVEKKLIAFQDKLEFQKQFIISSQMHALIQNTIFYINFDDWVNAIDTALFMLSFAKAQGLNSEIPKIITKTEPLLDLLKRDKQKYREEILNKHKDFEEKFLVIGRLEDDEWNERLMKLHEMFNEIYHEIKVSPDNKIT